MQSLEIKYRALAALSDPEVGEGGGIQGRHDEANDLSLIHIGWLMTASFVTLGVRWGIWPITDGHRRPFDERGVLLNAARSPRR